MNQRTTLILLVVFAAAAAYIGFSESRGPATRERIEQSTRVLGRFDPSQVETLLITRGEEKIELRREREGGAATPAAGNQGKNEELPGALPPASRWRMQTPVADRADAGAVDAFLTDLGALRREDTVAVPGANADPAKLVPYGLQNPRLKLKVTPKSADREASPEAEVFFGGDTPVQGRVFVRVAGREEVYAVDDRLRKQLEKGAGEFRDHGLADLGVTDIRRLTVKNNNAVGSALELTKEGDHWRLLKPQAARASDAKLGELVNRLAELRVARFLPVADKSAAGALAEPRGTITVATADNPPRTAELVVGKPVVESAPPSASAAATPGSGPAATPPPSAEVYASSPGRPGVLVVPRTVEEFLNLKPEDVRDRQLARVEPDGVDRIRLQPAGGSVFTLSRVKDKPKEWTLREGENGPERPANGIEVERLLNRLPAQNVGGFVADTAGDLPKYGLDHPVLRVSFLAVASEPTAESAAGERPVATISFGRTEGENIFARLEEEPFVVTLPKTVLEFASTDPIAWQAPGVFAVAPDRIRTLTVAVRDRPEVALERSADGASDDGDKNGGGTDAQGWKLVRGSGEGNTTVDGVAAASTASTLAKLRAVRWVGATRPEHGLDAPTATLAFTTSDPKLPAGKLFVGARAPEGGWFARVDGRPGTFLLNAPDHGTLLRPPLVTTPTPAAKATPSADTPSSPTPPAAGESSGQGG